MEDELLFPPPRRDDEREPLLLEEPLPRLAELLPRLAEPLPRLAELPPLLDREPPPEPVPLRTPRTAPRATPPTASPAFRAPVTPSTAPRLIVSRVRGEKTAAVAAATNADSVLNKSSSAKVSALLRSLCDVRYPAAIAAARTSHSSPDL